MLHVADRLLFPTKVVLRRRRICRSSSGWKSSVSDEIILLTYTSLVANCYILTFEQSCVNYRLTANLAILIAPYDGFIANERRLTYVSDQRVLGYLREESSQSIS